MIAKIEQLDETVAVGSELVALEVELNFPRGVLEMRERRLAVRPHGDEPAGNRVLGGIVVRSVRAESLVRRRRALEAIGERRDAALDQRLEFVAPRRFDKTPLPPR